MSKIPSDLQIAQTARIIAIDKVAAKAGIWKSELDLFGRFKAKVHLDILERLRQKENGKYIIVSAITPTPLGEGKTTTSIGLAQAIGAHLRRPTFVCLRQPSQGPTFSIKGGAAGGGYSQIMPMEDINLHLTGDIHAVTAANNLLAAAIDARLLHEGNQKDDEKLAIALCKNNVLTSSQLARLKRLNLSTTDVSRLSPEEKRRLFRLDIDPDTISWKRVVDTNDRLLRQIQIGLGPEEKGYVRHTGFDISAASEIMAVLALATSIHDLRARLGRMVVAFSRSGEPITAEDLNVAGALTVLLKDALMPNLLQTLEGTPAFVHCGPFANIAHGSSSVIADLIALKLADYVVTEAGFGADIGLEKFIHIKCRFANLVPHAAVIVVTIRALKMHGGGPKVVAGRPLDPAYTQNNPPLVEAGCANMEKAITIARSFGIPTVVAINVFASDSDEEIQIVRRHAEKAGAIGAFACTHFLHGGRGARELAEAVMAAADMPTDLKFLYPLEWSVEEKISSIATQIYGADGVDIEPTVSAKIKKYQQLGWDRLPICMAKTQLSLSHDPNLKGVPKGWRLPITDIRAAAGAGFLYPLCGDIRTMPGLPTRPAFMDIDIDETGRVVGLS